MPDRRSAVHGVDATIGDQRRRPAAITDPELLAIVVELNEAAGYLLTDRGDAAAVALARLVGARRNRAGEIGAQLELADLELIRLEEAA